jgi:hypothetical protein
VDFRKSTAVATTIATTFENNSNGSLHFPVIACQTTVSPVKSIYNVRGTLPRHCS